MHMSFLVTKGPSLRWEDLVPAFPPRGLPPPMTNHSTIHLFWARNAIYHGLKLLGLRSGDKILLPAYHCATLVEPVLQFGAIPVFYEVQRNCYIDMTDIERRIDRSTRALLAVHYFGFPQAAQMLRDFCRCHQLYYIEDCAHVLAGEVKGEPLGSFGDISVFSWRKVLPLYDGGQLVLNNPELESKIPLEGHNLLFQAKVFKNLLESLVEKQRGIVSRGLSAMLRHLDSIRTQGSFAHSSAKSVASLNNYNPKFERSKSRLSITPLSKYILRNTDIQAAVRKRRQNFAVLVHELGRIPGITLPSTSLEDGVCPMALPILAEDRSDLHLVLRERGIPAYTWGGVVHPSLRVSDFPNASHLYDHLVLLPVHQSLTDSNLSLIIRVVRESILQ